MRINSIFLPLRECGDNCNRGKHERSYSARSILISDHASFSHVSLLEHLHPKSGGLTSGIRRE